MASPDDPLGNPRYAEQWAAEWPLSRQMARVRRDHPLELWQDFDRRPHGPDVVMLRTAFVPDEGGVLRERGWTAPVRDESLEPLADSDQVDLFLGATSP